MLQSQLIGAWALTRFEARSGDTTTYPYSESAEGLLCYMSDGFMCAFLAHPAFRSIKTMTAETALMSANYSGRWRLDGDTVFHDVMFSNVPALIGATLARGVSLPSQNELELRTLEHLEIYPGAEQILKWVRRPGGA